MDVITLKIYTEAAASILLRSLKGKFISYLVSFLPPVLLGPLTPLITFLANKIFSWVGGQSEFQIFCKYTDIRVAKQGSALNQAIYNEILIKKNGTKDEILQAEKDADLAFDNFVVIGK